MAETTSLAPVPLYKSFPPECEVSDKKAYVSKVGCLQRTIHQYRADVSTASQLSFSITTPSPHLAMGKAYIQYRVRLKDLNSVTPGGLPCTGAQFYRPFAGQVGNCNNENLEGPRAFPLHSATGNFSHQINGVSFSVQSMSEILSALQVSEDLYGVDARTCPSAASKWWRGYTNPRDVVGMDTRFQASEFVAPCDSSFDSKEVTRNSQAWGVVYKNAAGAEPGYVEFTCYEPVLSPAFAWATKAQLPGLVGVSSMTLQYSGVQPARMWQSSLIYPVTNDATITPAAPGVITACRNMVGAFSSQSPWVEEPTLCVEYFSLPQELSVPPVISSPIFDLQVFRSSSTVQVGQTVLQPAAEGNQYLPAINRITGPIVQLSSIPDKILLFVKPELEPKKPNGFPAAMDGSFGSARPAHSSAQANDNFAIIDRVDLNFNNQAGLFTTYTCPDLYNLSVKAGSKLTFAEHALGAYCSPGRYAITPSRFARLLNTTAEVDEALDLPAIPGRGSVIVMNGSDLPTDGTFGQGTLGLFNFQASVDFAVPTIRESWETRGAIPQAANCPPNYRLYYVFIRSGTLTFDKTSGSMTRMVGEVAPQQLSHAEVISSSRATAMTGPQLFSGAGFWSDVWDNIKSIGPGLARGIATVGSMIPHPFGQAVGTAGNIVAKALGGKRGGARLAHRQLM